MGQKLCLQWGSMLPVTLLTMGQKLCVPSGNKPPHDTTNPEVRAVSPMGSTLPITLLALGQELCAPEGGVNPPRDTVTCRAELCFLVLLGVE